MFILNPISPRNFAGNDFSVLNLITEYITDTDAVVLRFQFCPHHGLCHEGTAVGSGSVKIRLIDSRPCDTVFFKQCLSVQIMSEITEPSVQLGEDDQIDLLVFDGTHQIGKITAVQFLTGNAVIDIDSLKDSVFSGFYVFYAPLLLVAQRISVFCLFITLYPNVDGTAQQTHHIIPVFYYSITGDMSRSTV